MFSFVGDTVVDPFCGTATTMVAALKTGRNSIGVELDTEYCRMSASRLMSENGSLFSNAELQIQLHAPGTIATTPTIAALQETGPEYRARSPKKIPRSTKKTVRHIRRSSAA
jgi:site-specific DNA-methyltransferase (adenine-specific)